MGRFSAPRPFLARLRRSAVRRLAGPGAVAALAAGLPAAPALAQGPVPQGPEFRVNTHTTSYQRDPVVAMDADGDFVVAWTSQYQDGDRGGVYAQRFDASGAPAGGEFRVNTSTTGDQLASAVAMDADGGFVVVWENYGESAFYRDVHAQRFDASGAPVGEEFRVNTSTTQDQAGPSVAMDAGGDFVIAWEGFGQGGDFHDVYAQRFDASGAPVGGEFRVNSYTSGSESSPSVAMDADGDFIVAWQGYELGGGGRGIYAQRYGASGARIGAEFHVNTSTTGDQESPSVAVDADGDFVIGWESRLDLWSDQDLYAQRFDATGAPAGAEFRVNDTTTGFMRNPAVTTDADGDVVVVWENAAQDAGAAGVFARSFDASGAPDGGEFRVNTHTANSQRRPTVAMDADGDFVVAWTGYGQDGSAAGVYAQRYGNVTVSAEAGPPDGPALAVVPSPLAAGGRVRYAVTQAGPVRLAVYDVLGREVAVLHDGAAAAGQHEAALDASALRPGVYVVRLEAGGDVLARPLTVAR